MISKDILTKEELEALLSPEELDAFKTEQHSRLDHELMLSPAHLLLAIRELEDNVMRLTARVAYLEGQTMSRQVAAAPEPEYVQTVELGAELIVSEPQYIQAVSAYPESENELEATTAASVPDLTELIEQNTPEQLLEPTREPNKTSASEIPIAETISEHPGSLVSRAERHRERKPSLLSKLLK